jgi:radical SAM protein with 4Fe4S-binding SPASM domain
MLNSSIHETASPAGISSDTALPKRGDNWFDIRGREAFDRCPPNADPKPWAEFLAKYKAGERLEFLSHPIQIDIELNGGCNMNCPFCLHGYETIPNRKMPVAMYEQLVRDAVAFGVRSLKLNYINEPLMRNDLEDMIRFAHGAGILNTYFVTNGSMLSPKRRRRLLYSGLTKLFCSIDAVTADTYDRQRTSGLFKRVRGNVRAFIRERNEAGRQFPLVLVSFLQNQINHHEAEAFAEEWVGLADVVSFQKMNEVPDHATGLTFEYDDPDMGCKFPFKQIVVDHNGLLLPCCKLSSKKLPLGNVAAITLEQAWASMGHLRKMHAANAWQSHPVCSHCMRCE